MNRLPNDDVIRRLAARTWERCEKLATFTEEPGRLTRTFLSPPMHDVHRELTAAMESCGMVVRVDALGNLIGRYAAANGESAPAFLWGSHLDTVPNAGKYDGTLGVLLALALVEALGGRRLPFALEVIGFSEEEGVRYRTPYLGSRAVTGQFAPELMALRDKDDVPLKEALERFGLDPDRVSEAACRRGDILGYLEAHIEQGPVLEQRGVPLGVVTAIAGQSRLRLRFTGKAAHAGTTPMLLRRDALTGTAEFVGAVEETGLATPELVATVGAITASPNVGNVIPGAVDVSLDVRHEEDAVRDQAVNHLLKRAADIARKRGLVWEVRERNDFAAVPMDPGLRTRLAAAIRNEDFSVVEMTSGAGHDAAILAVRVPSAMLFLRSPNGGVSHHPDETVFLEDIETALRVLLRFVVESESFFADKKEETQ